MQLSRNLLHTRQDLESKTELMQRTARDLGNRVMELRSLQEGVKAINSALALDKLLRLIVANAAQVLGTARCSIALLNGNEVVTMAASGVSPLSLWGTRFKQGEGVAGWVARGQNISPALIGDVRRDDRFLRIGEEPIGSLMCVPLVSGKTAIGALSATSPRLNAFTAEDLSRLEAFADQAVIAVKNSRLYEGLSEEKQRTEQNMRQIVAVNEVAGALVSVLNLEEILELIIERLAHLAGTSHCGVAFFDEEKGQLIGRLARGKGSERFKDYYAELQDDPALDQVVRERRPVVVNQADCRSRSQETLCRMWDIRTYLVSPLIAKDRVIGAIYLARDRDLPLAIRNRSLTTSFSHFAATAIENAQLYQHVWEKSTELEAILRGIGDGVIVTDQSEPAHDEPCGHAHLPARARCAAGTYVQDLISNESLSSLLQDTMGKTDGEAVIREIEFLACKTGNGTVIYQRTGLCHFQRGRRGARPGDRVARHHQPERVEKMKSNFLSVVSHELKTPLHSIKGFVDIILMGKTGAVNDMQTRLSDHRQTADGPAAEPDQRPAGVLAPGGRAGQAAARAVSPLAESPQRWWTSWSRRRATASSRWPARLAIDFPRRGRSRCAWSRCSPTWWTMPSSSHRRREVTIEGARPGGAACKSVRDTGHRHPAEEQEQDLRPLLPGGWQPNPALPGHRAWPDHLQAHHRTPSRAHLGREQAGRRQHLLFRRPQGASQGRGDARWTLRRFPESAPPPS